MKHVLLILGILFLAAGAASLGLSALAGMGYMRLMDGTAEMYASYRSEFYIFLWIGLGCVLLGVLFLVLRRRKLKKQGEKG